MERDEIIEGNKLIAEFMGYKLSDTFSPALPPHYINEEGETITGYIDTELKYHSSWDWLMTVIEKIQSIDITPAPNYTCYRIEIVVQGYVKISGFPMSSITTNVSNAGGLINAVWLAVVEFTKRHKQSTTHTGSVAGN